MSVISKIVKAALALDQKIQTCAARGAHKLASRSFSAGEETEALATVQAQDQMLKLERIRAQRAAALIEAHKRALFRMHSDIDDEIELADGRKQQQLAKAREHKQNAVQWQAASIGAQVQAEKALKAAEQLG